MSDFRRQRGKSAPYDLGRTWHGTSHTDEAHVPQIKQASVNINQVFRQRYIGVQLTKLQDSAKKCSKHWNKKFKSEKERKNEGKQQNIFKYHLKDVFKDFEELKKILPAELLRDGRDPIEGTPPPFPQQKDHNEAAGGFDQFRRDPIEVKPAPFHLEDTGRFNQPKRDPNEDILKQFQQRLDDLERKLVDTESRCKRAEDKARTLAAEKEDLMTRLSQVAGSKLRDNNPAITDLSDPNRPIKLVEKISELYDNEWTDGMEALEKSGMKESEALQVLLSVFTTSHEKCMEIARINIDNLQRQLSNPTNRQESYDDRIIYVPSHVLKQLKDTRKVAAEYQVGIPGIIQEVDKVLTGNHGQRVVQSCRKYIDRCVEYSWYMSIQDPPLEIEYQYTIGGKFEHDKMRAYTMSGKYVEYVVWPAIYLHKGGAMLSKAVVQGRSEAVNARATYAGPSVMDTFEQTQTIRPISENMSPQNTNRKGNFNQAMIDRSIKTESDINSFTKSMGTASGVSSTQREYYDSSGNSRYNSPKISTQGVRTVDKPRTYTGDFPRSTTPDQWSRYGTDQISRTGTPTRGKGQSNNSQYPSSKSHSTPHATQISVSREHTANMYQQQKGMGNRNLSQTTHIVHQNRDTPTTDSHAQSTNHGRGGHSTSSARMETNL